MVRTVSFSGLVPPFFVTLILYYKELKLAQISLDIVLVF